MSKGTGGQDAGTGADQPATTPAGLSGSRATQPLSPQMPAPRGRFVHQADDGTVTDVTEGVQALYDLIIGSLDWGSNHWDYESALPVAVIGRLGGFEGIEEVERYLNRRQHDDEAAAWRQAHLAPRASALRQLITGTGMSGLLGSAHDVPAHDHVFSSVGRCMWPLCFKRADDPVQVSPGLPPV